MARAKKTITQRNFAFGVLDDNFLEGKALEARGQSLRGGKNIKVTQAGTMIARPGTVYRKTLTTAEDVWEIRPAPDVEFAVLINDTSLQVLNSALTVVHTEASVAWTDASTVWVEPFREKTVIGCPQGLFILEYDNGSWSYGAFAFETAPGNETAQPYWVYQKGLTITPSAATGSITVTSSAALFTSAWVGMKIRYGFREITITGYTNSTTVSGTVVSRLPPSFDVVVASAVSFREGDVVVGADSNFQGLVTSISGSTLKVATLQNYDGPTVSEVISGPSGSSTVSSKTSISLLASSIWDEPLMSPVRGYPGAGAAAGGRLVLCDFPNAPDVVAISSARDITDFFVGAEDDDAIARRCGDNSPRWRHVVNAGDVLMFSDRGCYYVPIRESGVLTPSTFNLVSFDNRAANDVKPVKIDGGVLFVEGSGETVAVAQLSGNIYLRWTVTSVSNFHGDLIRTPKKLCGPPLYATGRDKYLFVVNADGTLAVVSWYADFENETVGFVPWETQGTFINVAPIFGAYYAIVDRQVGGGTSRFLEEFDEDAYLDSQVAWVDGVAVHTPDTTLEIVNNGYYGGEVYAPVSGIIPGSDVLTAGAVVGYNFDASALLWPVEHLDVPWVGMKPARTIRVSVSVKDTLSLSVRTNRTTKEIRPYAFEDDLSQPPPLKTEVFRFVVLGQRDHPEVEIMKAVPGPWHVLAVSQEVQA